MSEEVSIHRSTVRLEKPIYDVLVGVAMENHLHTRRRGPLAGPGLAADAAVGRVVVGTPPPERPHPASPDGGGEERPPPRESPPDLPALSGIFDQGGARL